MELHRQQEYVKYVVTGGAAQSSLLPPVLSSYRFTIGLRLALLLKVLLLIVVLCPPEQKDVRFRRCHRIDKLALCPRGRDTAGLPWIS